MILDTTIVRNILIYRNMKGIMIAIDESLDVLRIYSMYT